MSLILKFAFSLIYSGLGESLAFSVSKDYVFFLELRLYIVHHTSHQFVYGRHYFFKATA